MEKDINAWAAKRAGCKVGKPTQNARAHAKCGDPRKVRGPTQSAQTHAKCAGCVMNAGDAKCADAREMRGPRFNCAGHTECVRVTIAWRGEWAALPTHFPRTCHSMPTQCNRGSTRVGRDEPQSPGMLRVKIAMLIKESHFLKLFGDTAVFLLPYCFSIPAPFIMHHYTVQTLMTLLIQYKWYWYLFSPCMNKPLFLIVYAILSIGAFTHYDDKFAAYFNTRLIRQLI